MIGHRLKETRPDVVFHLAAQSLVLESYKNPIANWMTNILGTVNLLDALAYRHAGGRAASGTSGQDSSSSPPLEGARQSGLVERRREPAADPNATRIRFGIEHVGHSRIQIRQALLEHLNSF